MTNLIPTIAPKSDQLNADDLIGGPRTITVSKVSLSRDADQPIAIHFAGDDGKPYQPCKSLRRGLVQGWGSDGNQFAGQSMTLFRDDTVRFGNMAVGGIRISHMSGIDEDVTMALTATRGARKPYTVRPLAKRPLPNPEAIAAGRAAAVNGAAALTTWWDGLGRADKLALKPILDSELKPAAARADEAGQGQTFDAEQTEAAEAPPPAEDGDFPGDR